MADTTPRGGVSGSEGKAQPVIIVGALIIVALVGVIVALVLNLNREPTVIVQEPEAPEQRQFVINDDTPDEVFQEIIDAPVDSPEYYQVRMNLDWHFPDGASPSPDSYVENAETNSTNVYFDLVLADTEEVIYASPVIPLGSHLNNVTLDKDLDPGQYDCVMIYHLLDNEQRTLSTLRVALTIYVDG